MAQTTKDVDLVLQALADVIEARKKIVAEGGHADTSYVASLFIKGDDAILKKIGEEAAETIMAAKDLRHGPQNQASASTQKLVNEIADLWFHSMILLAQFNCRPEDVLTELQRRKGLSGIAEKAARSL